MKKETVGTTLEAECPSDAGGRSTVRTLQDWMNRISSFEDLAGRAVRGVLYGFDEAGEPLVDFPANGNRGPIVAISTVPLGEMDRNREIVLLFEDGDPTRPIVVGVRQSPGKAGQNAEKTEAHPLAIEVDGERLVYTAQREIVLRCGKASIQLLSDGSVRIRGTSVLSRASATNRIRGGNVQIN
jgi:hypothetical protein